MENIDIVIQQRDDSFERERELEEVVHALRVALIHREAIIVMLGDPVEPPKVPCYVLAVERLKELGYLREYDELTDYYELG